MAEPELPALEYPALYVFRAVARRSPTAVARVRRHVEAVVGALPDEAVSEKDSRTGRYQAVHVTCVVRSEEERRAVYERLRADAEVVFTL